MMNTKTQQVLDSVRSVGEAEEVIAALLQRFSSQTAFDRLTNEARYAHKPVGVVARRTASNLLNSFVTRKSEGCTY